MLKKSKNKLIVIFLIVFSMVCVFVFYIMENYENAEDIITDRNDINKVSEESLSNDNFLESNLKSDKEIKKDDSDDEGFNEDKNSINKILVHIDGAVNNPGIVKLDENSRLLNAIECAGGLTAEADITKINLASYLEDGIKVYIPSKSDGDNVVFNTENSYFETYNQASSGENIKINSEKNDNTQNKSSKKQVLNNKWTSKVNINKANAEELKTLPGVGEGTASKIIEYRNKNGKFKKIEDIKEVNGIGNNKYEKIKEYICIK